MAQLDVLKSHFAFLASSQGCIYESDYDSACHSIANEGLLGELADWLLEQNYVLKKGIGPQYEQEVKQQVKNPSVNNVKDTKHRTHKNKNKLQKSKKKADEEDDLYEKVSAWIAAHVHEYLPPRKPFTYPNTPPDTFEDYVDTFMYAIEEEFEAEFAAEFDTDWVGEMAYEALGEATATREGYEEAAKEDAYESEWKERSLENKSSFHLNKIIEDMQEFEDEFLPAWKKWKASLDDTHEFVALLASLGLTAQDFSNYEQAQRSIMQLIESYANEIPEDAYIPNTALQGEFLKIDPEAKLPINQRITNAISRIFDPTVLSEIFSELYRGIQSGFETRPRSPESQTPTTPPEAMPSGTREFELEPGPSGLETASKKAKRVVRKASKARITKIATSVARIGYSDKERVHVKFDNGAKFVSYIAETPLQKAAGLEVFDSLGSAEGLFFPFEETGRVTFHMGSVKFPIDIVFLMDTPHGLEVGKVVANIQPGSLEWWSHPNTTAVLEVLGGMCKRANIEVGSVCTITHRIEAQGLPPEYNLDLPDYAGEHDIFDLFKLLSEYHSGQGDPIYAVQSRESKHNISLDELNAIESLLEDIDDGQYMPGYPHGQVAPGEGPMGIQEEEEYTQEQEEASNDMDVARSWLPVIREIISENSPEENDEDEPQEDDIFMKPSGPLGGRTSVSAGGKFLGEFSTEEEAEAAIKEWMEANQFYPNVWKISDHGNVIGPIVLE